MNGVISTALLAFCLLVSHESFAQPVADGMPSYEEFEKKISLYPYRAEAERAAKIKSGIAALKVCMGKEQVQSKIGVPDYSRASYGPKGPSEKWLGSSWTYYLAKQSSLVNTNDSTVEVFFDTKNRAHWIVPHHIDGAHEIGAVSVKCL
jgi:hypothetical protein